ncbi:MAG: SMP-30/gluconolactonase/LRE family protein [Verrucomicrobiales bacterium]|nr:SMP-30/gluconolactonase/LRE family protein [Verrucomicrobiales bacterium]
MSGLNHSLTGIVFAAVLVASLASAEIQIETVAGTGSRDYSGDSGPAAEATLNNPFGVIVAPDGDIIFCDTGNHVIRRISRASGDIETLVGTGEIGLNGDEGDPLQASLHEPYEVRFHPSGDLYWVEMKNHVIRRLDARTNKVERVAGTGKSGFSGDGGLAVEATMNRPHSIQFDASGETLLICDIGNHRIRAVDLSSGIISTWCGNGSAEATPDGALVSSKTPLKGPRALDLAPNGDLWLALREGNQVFRIDAKAMTLHHIAGSGKKGFHPEPRSAQDAELSGPKGVAISPDGKLVYLADTESHTVRAIDFRGDEPVVRLIAGTGSRGDGPDTPDPLVCEMNRLHGVGVDPVNGDLYIGDSETNKVRKVSGLPGELPMARRSLKEYETDEFLIDGRACRVTKPTVPAEGNPWIWRARFYGAFPAVDEALLAEGWHVAWIDVGHLFGGPEAMKTFDQFYLSALERYDLKNTPILEGFSRGGLAATNWAIQNPGRVAGLYLDAPVLDINSWPRQASDELYSKALDAYGLDEATLDEWRGPLDRLEALISEKVPLFLVAGGNDKVVPYNENGGRLEKFYRAKEGAITTLIKAGAGHHPHSLHDPSKVVEWAKSLVE